MKKLIVALVAGTLMSTTSGCLSVVEGDKVYTISAKKVVIGASLEDAEAKIPEGADILDFTHTRSLFGLVQYTAIKGTK